MKCIAKNLRKCLSRAAVTANYGMLCLCFFIWGCLQSTSSSSFNSSCCSCSLGSALLDRLFFAAVKAAKGHVWRTRVIDRFAGLRFISYSLQKPHVLP